MCCTGSPIDLQNMQSPQVQGMMNILAPLIAQGLGRGATPFPGQLSAGADPGQMAAMNTMMGMGGYGGYGGGQGGGGMGGGGNLGPLRPPTQPHVDPYAPGGYGGVPALYGESQKVESPGKDPYWGIPGKHVWDDPARPPIFKGPLDPDPANRPDPGPAWGQDPYDPNNPFTGNQSAQPPWWRWL